MNSNDYRLDWSELAFGSKKPIRDLQAIFIPAPREMSRQRFTQLVKTYLPAGNIIIGHAREAYVAGFEDQPQFKLLDIATVQPIIDKVNASASPHKIYTLTYFQRELNYIFEKLDFKKVLLVNGSWLHTFHTRSEYYTLVGKGTPLEHISPFASDSEAQDYAAVMAPKLNHLYPLPAGVFSAVEMLQHAGTAARFSYDYNYQTGLCLGRAVKGKKDAYEFVAWAHNKIVPYETYALHHGASRERNFSPPHTLNHYDTVHAEVELILTAQKTGIDLRDTTLFINLLPCPPCARMLADSDIKAVVYKQDHSEGYAVQVLELAGKNVRRIV
jgi:deoxycytidylate deaminase